MYALRISLLLALLAFVSFNAFGQNRTKTFPLGKEVGVENILYCSSKEAAIEAAEGYADADEHGAVVMFSYNKLGVCNLGSGAVTYRALVFRSPKGENGVFSVYEYTTRNGQVWYEITNWTAEGEI